MFQDLQDNSVLALKLPSGQAVEIASLDQLANTTTSLLRGVHEVQTNWPNLLANIDRTIELIKGLLNLELIEKYSEKCGIENLTTNLIGGIARHSYYQKIFEKPENLKTLVELAQIQKSRLHVELGENLNSCRLLLDEMIEKIKATDIHNLVAATGVEELKNWCVQLNANEQHLSEVQLKQLNNQLELFKTEVASYIKQVEAGFAATQIQLVECKNELKRRKGVAEIHTKHPVIRPIVDELSEVIKMDVSISEYDFSKIYAEFSTKQVVAALSDIGKHFDASIRAKIVNELKSNISSFEKLQQAVAEWSGLPRIDIDAKIASFGLLRTHAHIQCCQEKGIDSSTASKIIAHANLCFFEDANKILELLEALAEYYQLAGKRPWRRIDDPKEFPEDFCSVEKIRRHASKVEQLKTALPQDLIILEEILTPFRRDLEKGVARISSVRSNVRFMSDLLFNVFFYYGDFDPFYSAEQLIDRSIALGVIKPHEIRKIAEALRFFSNSGHISIFGGKKIYFQLNPSNPDSEKDAKLRILSKNIKPVLNPLSAACDFVLSHIDSGHLSKDSDKLPPIPKSIQNYLFASEGLRNMREVRSCDASFRAFCGVMYQMFPGDSVIPVDDIHLQDQLESALELGLSKTREHRRFSVGHSIYIGMIAPIDQYFTYKENLEKLIEYAHENQISDVENCANDFLSQISSLSEEIRKFWKAIPRQTHFPQTLKIFDWRACLNSVQLFYDFLDSSNEVVNRLEACLVAQITKSGINLGG